MYIALRHEDERRAERDQERTITVAVALAERLVGGALELDPTLIASIAKTALEEARGTRRVLIEANPADAEPLRASLATLGRAEGSVHVTINETLARGDLCLHTELGTLHARIAPQLERLAQALRDVLGFT
jgi:flagellar biosynthesis/type III secretory pathway protein FliH